MILGQEKRSFLGLKGAKPDQIEDPTSKLHNQASINNQPNLNTIKSLKFSKGLVPSRLDFNGLKPVAYLDNPPK